MLAVFILLSFAILTFSLVPQNTIINNRYTSNFLIFCLFVYVSVILVNFDNPSGDMRIYVDEILVFSNLSLSSAIAVSDRDLFFVIFQWVSAQISTTPDFFYFIIWFSFASLLLFSLRKEFKPWQVAVIFFCYLNYFIFFNYITNTVRQGLAIGVLFLAIFQLLTNKNRLLFYVSLISAPLFHLTTLPLSLMLLLLRKIKINMKLLVVVWVIFASFYMTGINQLLFGQLSNLFPAIDSYTSDSVLDRYTGGTNRLDFLIFGGFWIIYAFIAKRKMFDGLDIKYNLLVKIYIAFNIYYLSFGFIGFSDRLASYSWFLIPVLILYPILKGGKNRRVLLFSILFGFVVLSIIRGSILFNQPLYY